MKSLGRMLGLLALMSAAVQAAGFEKTTVWSGHWSGLGGAAVSGVTGSESVYFNPAGLAMTGGLQGDLSLNFSPTWSQYEGPFLGNEEVKSENEVSPIFAATLAYQMTPTLGLGAGVFVSGGSKATYKGVDFSSTAADLGLEEDFEMRPDVSSSLNLVEASVGAGYEILPGWRLGAAWRAAFVQAQLSSPQSRTQDATNDEDPDGLALIDLQFKDLKDSSYSSFRVGSQYLGSGWGVGVNFRSTLAFKAQGTVSGEAEIESALTPSFDDGEPIEIESQAASVAAQFPLQMEAGAHVELPFDLTLFTAYSWTQYSQVQELKVEGGKIELDNGEEFDVAEASVPTHWKDQSVVKAGLQWDGLHNFPIRLGYAYVSQVTPKDYASPTFSTPSAGHVYSGGFGYKANEEVGLDAAFEWASSSAKVGLTDLGVDASSTAPGKYQSSAYVLHAGLTYRF